MKLFYSRLFYVGSKLALLALSSTAHPCFIPPSVFYPLIRVLSPHPCFIHSSVFYPLIRVLSLHPCFIPSCVFYPLMRVLSPHACFIPSSVFYPLIRVLSRHPCFIPSFVSVSVPSVSVFYPNPAINCILVLISSYMMCLLHIRYQNNLIFILWNCLTRQCLSLLEVESGLICIIVF